MRMNIFQIVLLAVIKHFQTIHQKAAQLTFQMMQMEISLIAHLKTILLKLF